MLCCIIRLKLACFSVLQLLVTKDGIRMQSQLSHYLMLAKRWAWMIVLGIVICGGGTYIVSKLIHPVYQASAVIVLNLGSINSTAFDNTNASLAALPTYAQLATNPTVLESVVAQHKGLTLN